MRYKALPLILQVELAECGLACLCMLLNYYGVEVNLTDLREVAEYSPKGMPMSVLKKIAEQFGFEVNVLRVEINQLATLRLPCIAHWDMNHFVVISKMDKNFITLHDPARGVRKINLAELDYSFTGVILEIFPTASIPQFKSVKPSRLLSLKSFWKNNKSALIKLIAFSFLIEICSLAGIKLFQVGIDSVVNLLPMVLLIFFGVKLVEASATGLRSLIVASTGSQLNASLGASTMRHFLSLPLIFFENRQVGDLLSRFGSIDRVRMILTEGAFESVVDTVLSLLAVLMMLFYSPYLTLIAVIAAFIYLILRLLQDKNFRHYQEESLFLRGIENSVFMETLRAISSFKIFSAEKQRLKLWQNKYIAYLNAVLKIACRQSLYNSIKKLLQGIDLALIFVLGCSLVKANKISVGVLYAFLACRQQFVMALSSLTDKISEFSILKLHLGRLNEIFASPAEPVANDTLLSSLTLSRCLRIENLCFRYRGEEQYILNNINFHIQSGEIIAITGPSGCGKSTLLKILMGLVAPSFGNIYIDQVALFPNAVGAYRKLISGVLQSDQLLSGTLLENITFFAPVPNVAHAEFCAEMAGIMQEIKFFPLGLYTLIGDMGSVLSGGQKQRLLLARALYARPQILFLDEATSHLDQKKEQQVNKAIRELNITTVMIAHRAETINMADKVLRLT